MSIQDRPRKFILPHLFRVFLMLCCIPYMPLVAQAGEPTDTPTLEDVEAAYQSGDKEAARKGLAQLAPAGNAAINYRLGYMMAEGIGGPVNLNGAKPFLEVASAQGYLPAHTLLARIYLSTNPEITNYQRAAELLGQAVAQDVPEAGFYLAQMLRLGRGIKADPPRALHLLEKAARAGNAEAQFALSQMYSRGEGTTPDKAQAARWLLQAAETGSTNAQLSLSLNYQRGSGFPQDDAKALQWLKAAAEGGFPLAQRMLGSAYLTGEGVEADPGKAISA